MLLFCGKTLPPASPEKLVKVHSREKSRAGAKASSATTSTAVVTKMI